ncbi:MAG: hypothetical protein IJ191_09130 [Treponema sp.]|nr:hypothetical protein [Treponema sp.]
MTENSCGHKKIRSNGAALPLLVALHKQPKRWLLFLAIMMIAHYGIACQVFFFVLVLFASFSA